MKPKTCFLLAALVAAGVLLMDGLSRNYALLDGRVYPRDASVLALPEGVADVQGLTRFPHLRWLDLRGRGITGEEYERIAEIVPQCRVVWELAFQDSAVLTSLRQLTLTRLEEGDGALLDYLPRLTTVEAQGCRDYPQLLALAQRRPECFVHYTVTVGGREYDCRERTLAPGECSREAIASALEYLPQARAADLRGTGLTRQQARQLYREFPRIRFLWEEQLGDAVFPTNARVVDLSGIPMEDTRQVEALLPYLPEVERVIMCDCGIASQEMEALGKRHPNIRFVWRVQLGPLTARTDDTWFAPITQHQLIGGHDADELKYCIDMECIDLGHCWIRDCAWASNMKKLKYLVLADSYVTDLTPLSELKNLAYLELFVTPVRDLSPLLGCTGLEDLNLGYTYADPTPVSQMHWLKNLWWGGIHHVPWVNGREPAALLREQLTDTRLTFYAGSSTGLGWRNLPHYYEMRDRIGMYYMSG